MKILWVTTFRSFGISKKNDAVQKKFLADIKKLKNDITLSVTIFNESNIRKNVKIKGISPVFFKNKNKLLHNSKYSQSICMQNAIKLLDNTYDCVVWSTADISIPKNFITKIESYKEKNILMTAFPMHYVNSKKEVDSYSSNWGLDLFILKIKSQEKIIKFKKLINQCQNYGWGCYEHFFSSVSDGLRIKYINICKNLVIKKFNNDRNAFNDLRENEIKSWKINQNYLIKYLQRNNLSQFFAKGSMYFLIYKFFNLRELNFRLFIIYIKILLKFPFNLIRFFSSKLFN
jgi:hypothetical protein